ncbi:Alkaline phosphatase family protein [Sulfidibacter corallicola]|uniref:Alkaline phosphatase family protein n=1 Tax=Sulfidibacter corallicola TaxID=2818388 RepID=A0A8A4TTI7_SULCO|nr:alkaline phosphatase family protein [Sulfidibacter corallicola]QTD52408.1 alkaline phosphatase family protein [Sulfidibacter corallicola]
MPHIEHLVVLMLESRSFDHMLGYLGHPDSSFKGLSGNETNAWYPGLPPAKVSNRADYTVPFAPDASHEGVMFQMTGAPGPYRPPYRVNNSGFAFSYELSALQQGGRPRQGERAMRCFQPAKVPVLAGLARDFAVCDQWFCSVPGGSWPNRNFVHAATSDGEVGSVLRPYKNRTIFEQLSEAEKSWTIYHEGPAHSWTFPRLWRRRENRKNFKHIDRLYVDVERNNLANYTFIEPNYGNLWPPSRSSNSQHTASNTRTSLNFEAGEQLIKDIYRALISERQIWEKTLFVITYAQHGGFYDHEPPPTTVPPDDKYNAHFKFDLLGPRVPAVLVSPWIPRGTVDHTRYDHASIVRTARDLFAPELGPLTRRDAASRSFLHNLSLEQPRSDFPDLAHPLAFEADEPSGVRPAFTLLAGNANQEPVDLASMDDFHRDLVWLAREVETCLVEEARGADPSLNEMRWWGPMCGSTVPDFPSREALRKYLRHICSMFHKSGEAYIRVADAEGNCYEMPSAVLLDRLIAELGKSRRKRAFIRIWDGVGRHLTFEKSGDLTLENSDGEMIAFPDLDLEDSRCMMQSFREGNGDRLQLEFERMESAR